nr:hypothetical protein BV87_13655 [Sphingobium yanoikuyae]
MIWRSTGTAAGACASRWCSTGRSAAPCACWKPEPAAPAARRPSPYRDARMEAALLPAMGGMHVDARRHEAGAAIFGYDPQLIDQPLTGEAL